MARQFLPALRSRLGVGAPADIETKSSSFRVHDAFGSMPHTHVFGTQDRAAAWDLERVITEAYERSVWAYRCVETIASHQARLPVWVKQDEQTLSKYPMYRLWNKRANPHESARVFRERLSSNVLLSKRGAFIEVTRTRTGRVARYDLLPPERMRPVPDLRGNYVEKWEFTQRDGRVREIWPEHVRWVRKPHPTDPFSGVTPLEAAGISVDLDLMARLYNVSFMRNDGRPGGILGIDTTGVGEQEMNRVESRFAPGVEHAGRLSVVATGKEGMAYVDTSARPRDMAYETTSSNAKDEILAAFGVPESVLGNASERTFSNADQEEYNFWSATMVPHLEMIAAALDEDSEDQLETYIDTSEVEALELPARKRREELRKEHEQGLINIDEYREDTDREPYNNPHSRALWISAQKVPVPFREEDKAELGMIGPGGGQPGAQGGAPGGQLPPGGDAGGSTAADAVAEARGESDIDPDQDPSADVDGTAAEAVAEALERKDAAAAAAVEYDPGDEPGDQVEMAAAAALSALLARQAGVITARLDSPRLRAGTKFWTPSSADDTRGGDEPLDMTKAVDAARWSEEVNDTLVTIAQDAAAASGAGLLASFAAAGLIPDSPEQPEAWLRVAGQAAAGTTMGTLAAAADAMTSFLDDLAAAVTPIAESATDIEDVKRAVAGFYQTRAGRFSRSVATMVAQQTTVAAREDAAGLLIPAPPADGGDVLSLVVVRNWRTQRDAQVRDEHAAAEGQQRHLGRPFDVGEAQLDFPGDPAGPPHLVFGCRCRLTYSVAGEGVFMVPSMN